MITTVEKVKSIYGKTGTENDVLIADQIQVVTDSIAEYCNRVFVLTGEVRKVKGDGVHYADVARLYASGEYTLDSVAKTITAAGNDFADFAEGDNVFLCSSLRNDGFLSIASKTNSVLTVSEDLVNESGNFDIFLVSFPKSLSNIAARMVGYDVYKRNKAEGLTSQKVGTWSGQYRDLGPLGYPDDVAMGLNSYKLHSSSSGEGRYRSADYLCQMKGVRYA